uniref:Stabilization protein n=1 Tax=Geladintestivirus 1 TaxID=3233133 RepID=A0AAU8MJJ2_9CAUD
MIMVGTISSTIQLLDQEINMSRIIPKLNLNKVPQIVDNNSLIFAKNIKLRKNGSIVRDDGIVNVKFPNNYRLYDIVGYIADNTKIYFFLYNKENKYSRIIQYNESNDVVTRINCNWNWSGGDIDGYVTINLNSDILLTIIEYNADKKVPIKTINTSISSEYDLESFYTQCPEIPITNLKFNSYYNRVIPNGQYQFFIRYEIKKDQYTKWFLASKELYSGTPKVTDTIHGSFQYIDTSTDSSISFVFDVEHLDKNNIDKYKSFQIGFILSHDEEVVARAWKKFNLNTEKVYFDYDQDYITEIDINDILEDTFELYNVRNICNFKNKTYISNYEETNFNENLKSYVNDINIELTDTSNNSVTDFYYKGYAASYETIEINKETKHIITGSENKAYSVQNDIIINTPVFNLEPNSYSIEGKYALPYKDIGIDSYIDISNLENLSKEELEKILIKLNRAALNYYYFEDKECDKHQATKIYYPSSITIDNNTIMVPTEVQFDIKFNYEHIKDKDFLTKELEPREVNINEYLDYINEQIRPYLTNYSYEDKKLWSKTNQETLDSFKVEGYCDASHLLSYGDIYFDSEDNILIDDNLITNPDNLNKFKAFLLAASEQGTFNFKIKNRNYTLKDKKVYGSFNTTTIENNISRSESIDNFAQQTLLPLKKYYFAIHFITNTGEITNGYLINKTPLIYPYKENVVKNKRIIYPKFTNIKVPSNYKGYFISIANGGNNVAQLKNGEKIDDYVVYDCIEIDTLLFANYDEICALDYDDENVNTISNFKAKEGIYNPSGIASENKLKLFGSSGKVVFNAEYFKDGVYNDLMLVNNSEVDVDNLTFVKCTPYIDSSKSEYVCYKDDNLLGFITQVVKPISNEFNQYISGSELYKKTVEEKLLDLTEDTDFNHYKNKYTKPYFIYSEYNLRLLSLTDKIYTRIKSVTNSAGTKRRPLFLAMESLTLSDCYTFPSMYKSTTRKLFSQYNENSVSVFNNTIRASDVISDEGRTITHKFTATNYYNIPTHKGKIVLMKSAGNIILVHCEDSLFLFSGSQSLMSEQGGNVQTNESDPFDTGIKEVEGSDKGYAGIQEKHHASIIQNAYIFYDRDDNTIFFYSGEGQGFQIISDPIQELLDYNRIKDVIFANDYYNDRFIMKIVFDDDITITLSFNYKTKSFASIHDFTFDKSFNTKNKCYFLYKKETDKSKIYRLSKTAITYGDLYKATDLYPIIKYKDNTNNDRYYRIVDVIFNDGYEVVKTLNSLQWIGHKIINKFAKFNNDDLLTHFMAEDVSRNKEFVDGILIYSDSCSSGYLYFNYSNETLLENGNPVDNNGIWSFNQFRNQLSKTNIFYLYDEDLAKKLKNKYPESVISKDNSGYLIKDGTRIINKKYTTPSDQKSLIYGKYFVVRFLIREDIDFILENTIFNI